MSSPSRTRHILAVDLGTSGAKVALVGIDGRVAAWEFEPVELLVLPGGGAEQRPDDWWRAVVAATRRVLAGHDGPGADIAAVCCSTQGEGTVPVDESGAPLANCILWMDMRGAPNLRRQFGGFPAMQGISLLRVRRWVKLTGGMPSPTGKDPAAHMLYVRDELPDVYARTHKFLGVPDYLNFKLCGRMAASYDSILTSWVTDNRDADGVKYDADLVRDSGVEADKLPEIVKCTEVLGRLTPAAAEELGLSPETQVVAGAIDTTAAAVGAGTTDDFAVHLYLGTSSWMAAHVPFKKTDVFSSLASVPCALPGRWLLMALQATAGGNLTWLRDNVLYHKDELLAEEEQPDVFKIFDQIARRVPPGSNGVLYTPWIWGERAPVDDRALRAGLYNLSLANTREDIVRAFFEGIALNTRWLLGPVRKFLGRPVESINLVGGGGQSDVWPQIIADVMGVTVRRVRDPIQANARGAAWIAAAGLGEISFADVPRLVEFDGEFQPDAAARPVHDAQYKTFIEIHKRMRPVYRRINRDRRGES
ncbi:MAG TPA: FGGY-family carbohydrate kinase [Thermoleophilia bacterium]|nr:FGGY-family carbohydrate kinase [Thermoleophilia bacterium]